MALWDNFFKRAPGGGGISDATPGKAPDSRRQGDTGVRHLGGFLFENERSAQLTGWQRYTTYKEILTNTSIVAAGTRYFLNILAKASWKVLPATDEEGDVLEGAQEVADLVESCMGDMEQSWGRVIRRGAMYRYYGFNIQEWTAKRRPDGKIGILALDPRPQVTIDRWDLDQWGIVQGVWQRSADGYTDKYLDRRRLIYLVDDTLDEGPAGLGLLRHLVRDAERLRAYEELEEVGFETDLRGIPVARAPLAQLEDMVAKSAITRAEFEGAIKAVKDFISGVVRNKKLGIMLDSATFESKDEAGRPSGEKLYDVELLNGSSTSAEQLAHAIQRINSQMARTLGVEHLMLGTDGAGSLALGKVKTSDFYMVVDSTQTEVKEGYQRDYIATICDLNGIRPELRPTYSTDAVQFRDVEGMAATLRDMATAGAVLEADDPAIKEMRDYMGLSSPSTASVDRAMEDAALGHETAQAALAAAELAGKPVPGPAGRPAPKPGNRNRSQPKPSRANPPRGKP